MAHLSGKYLGHLLIATAKDGNFQIYPIAFTVVDTESKDSWSYFFNEMKKNVLPDSVDLIIVSDRHLGIKEVAKNVYSLASHGYCIFHMYQNLKRVSTYAGLKDQWFNVAKAYTVDEFNFELERLNRSTLGAVRKALKVPLHQWARAYFEVDRYIVTTNNSECINNLFNEERGWPILSLFQSILETYVKWFCERRDSTSIWCDLSTRSVNAVLKDRYKYCLSMSVQRLSECEALVKDGIKKYEVNLQDKTCQCRVLQRDRIPCAHAIALAKDRGVNIHTMVSEYYSNAYLRDVYKETIHIAPLYLSGPFLEKFPRSHA